MNSSLSSIYCVSVPSPTEVEIVYFRFAITMSYVPNPVVSTVTAPEFTDSACVAVSVG